ncbi:hypothetical protein HHK36_017360 [Tetracentron sinense]|uniref:Uncharacterized protein n=1 Tax=Tetracentron sinense TaxID=13715 RepID=A0A835DBV1_TETSI|nr:hypothetical protein HHK36_017360 [Tetracentron sinense]
MGVVPLTYGGGRDLPIGCIPTKSRRKSPGMDQGLTYISEMKKIKGRGKPYPVVLLPKVVVAGGELQHMVVVPGGATAGVRGGDEEWFEDNAFASRPDASMRVAKMEHDETGCQAPEGPILCVNNCGFFGSAATMNMCSKCHKDLVLKQERAQLAASSIGSIVNGSSSINGKEPVVAVTVDVQVPVGPVETEIIVTQASCASALSESDEAKVKEGPNRCNSCRKRVGLTGFNCRCGDLFCAVHRYSDKHDCPFDYRTAGRDAIAKANPVVSFMGINGWKHDGASLQSEVLYIPFDLRGFLCWLQVYACTYKKGGLGLIVSPVYPFPLWIRFRPGGLIEWNLIHGLDGGEVPKVADFLGVSKSENQPDLSVYNQILATGSDYIFPNDTLLPLQNSAGAGAGAGAAAKDFDSQENANDLQSLTLSMGSGNGSNGESSGGNSNSIVEAAPRRSLDTFGQRTSIYRGIDGLEDMKLIYGTTVVDGKASRGKVAKYIWVSGYDKEEKAARAYDLAALKYWGTSTTTNFPISNYERELEEMKHMTRQEFVASIRRKSSGFSRGASMYRGVTRHHQHGRWQARIGRVAGNKDLYLGTFTTEEEAAEAYDIAAIKFRGLNAVTNFDMNRYDVKSILESNTLPIGGGAAKRIKEAQAIESSRKREEMKALGSSFQYGSSSSFQAYPLMQPLEQPQPLLALQNQDPQFHQNYINTNHQLLQYPIASVLHSNQNSQFHHNYLQNNPTFLHGLMTMGSSSSAVEHNGSSSGSYIGGFFGNGIGIAGNSTTVNPSVGSTEDLGLVKVDYDMASGSYGGWSTDSVQGSNPGAFTMWND